MMAGEQGLLESIEDGGVGISHRESETVGADGSAAIAEGRADVVRERRERSEVTCAIDDPPHVAQRARRLRRYD